MNYSRLSKNDLLTELKKRDRAIARLQNASGMHAVTIASSERTARDARNARNALQERTKELNCLYLLSAYLDDAGDKPEKALRKLPALLKKSWQFPRDVCARVVYGKKTYATANYKNSRWKMAADIVVDGTKSGRIEVRYLVKKPAAAEGPFLAEERHLLDEVAERVGRSLERTRIAVEREAANRQLAANNQQLRATEQQLRAGNQQLQAIEQQLRAANQQLAASEAVIRQEQERSMALFDTFPGILYVVDPDTYEVLFVNAAFQNMLGVDPVGKKCYRAFQGFMKPCDFCTNAALRRNGGKPYQWEYHNEKLGRTFSIMDQLIDWPDGRKVRFEYAADITDVKEAQATLHEEKERFEVIFDRSTAGKALTAPDGTLLKINSAFAEMLGRSVEEMQSVNFAEITHPDDLAESKESIRSLLAGEQTAYRMQKRYFHKDGSAVWCDVGTTLLRDDKGNPKYFITGILDITEQKRLSLKMAESEKRFRTLFDNINEGFALHEIITDDDGAPVDYRYLAINPAFERLTGLPAESSIGKTVCEILPGTKDDPADWIGRFGNIALTGEPLTVEDYSEPLGKWFLVNGFCPQHGQFAVTFTDITARKKLMNRLTEEKEKLERFMEISGDLITQVDPDGNFMYVNRVAEDYLGISPEEAVGMSAFGFIHPDDRAETDGKFQKWIRDRVASASFENRQVSSKDGHVTPMLWTINPKFSDDGTFEYVWSVARDITERMRMETELQATLENLERSNKELEQFAYVASHDLQEPLRMVSSYVELLADRYKGKLDDDANDFIGFAVDGATRMQNLIRDLLAFSRVSTRGNEFVPVDTGKLVDTVTQSLETILKETGAVVEVDAMPTVTADPIQLERVFQNLIQNAVKFTPEERTPHIRIRADREADTWHFRVSDNGAGIDKQYFDKVFIIFQRLNRKSRYGGTGIGLSICKRIVERHGGRIWIESEPGQGSTFHISLPVTAK